MSDVIRQIVTFPFSLFSFVSILKETVPSVDEHPQSSFLDVLLPVGSGGPRRKEGLRTREVRREAKKREY